MIILRDRDIVDERHVVDIKYSYSHASAIVVDGDHYDNITYYDNDDMRTYNNEAIIDATDEEKEAYRKYSRHFEVGDTVYINRGRKMVGEKKVIKDFYTYQVFNTRSYHDTDYLVFTDGTKVAKHHCDFEPKIGV